MQVKILYKLKRKCLFVDSLPVYTNILLKLSPNCFRPLVKRRCKAAHKSVINKAEVSVVKTKEETNWEGKSKQVIHKP